MADNVVGVVRVDAEVSSAGVHAGTKDATKSLEKFGKRIESIGRGITMAGVGLTAGITAPFVALVKESMTAAQEARDAMAQVESAQKSMGQVAGFTTDQLKAQALQLEQLSTFDDTEILRKVTSNMLTFGNVTGKVFSDAQRLAVDLSTRLGTDLQSATIMLGKALNDPKRGVSALAEVGVSFTEQQIEQIKAMTEAGKVTEAQTMILSELEKQYAGAAKAAQDATPGDEARDQWNQLKETVGEFALQVLPKLVDPLRDLLALFNNLSPEMQKTVVGVAAVGAALGPIMLGLGPIISLMGSFIAKSAAMAASTQVAAAASGTAAAASGGMLAALAPLLPVIAGVAAAAGAAYAVWKNWDTIGPIFKDTGKAIMDALGPTVTSIMETAGQVMTELTQGPFGQYLAGVVERLGELAKGVAEVLGTILPPLIRSFGALIEGTMKMVGGALNLVMGLLTGDFAGAWEGAKALVTGWVDTVLGVIEGLAPGATAAMAQLYQGVKTWLQDKLGAVFDWVTDKVEAVDRAFFNLFDAVVGHSYIPDMVDGIGTHMARLDQVMVAQADKATKSTADKFKELAQQVAPLLDRLFPEAALWNQYQTDLALIDQALAAHMVTLDQAAAAKGRLFRGYLDDSGQGDEGMPKWLNDSTLGDKIVKGVGPSKDELEKWGKTLFPDLAKSAEDSTAQVIESFTAMARDVVGTMRGMVSAFKSGDILGGILGVLDVVAKIAGAIGGGSKPGGFSPSSVPKFNTGGSFQVGGAPGTDTNLVQFRATKGEMVNITRRGGVAPAGGGVKFDLRGAVMTADLLRQMETMADGAAVRGAAGGASLVQQRMTRSRMHQL